MRMAFAALAILASALAPPALAAPFRDDAGRVVEVPAPPRRVFTAGPPAAILLYTLAPERLLGWPRENRPAEKRFLAEPYASLPATGRLTGRGATASPEGVLALRPDLLLDVGSTRGTFVDLAERTQAQLGIPYVLLDGRFDAVPHTYRQLGALLGVPERGEELARWSETLLADIAARLKDIPQDRRPRAYYGRGPDGLETGLRGSINTEVLELVGARNVAAAGGEGGLAQVSLEQVLAWDPEVIVTTDPNFLKALEADPRWAGVSAVRAGRTHLAPKLPFGWVDFPPGVNRLVGARWLASVLYPDRFPEDIRPLVKDFYQRFYHVTLSDAQVQELLDVAEADTVGR